MCRDCGCGTGARPVHHHHEHHPEPARRTVAVGEALLAKNDRLAAKNRAEFRARGLRVVNVLSSPGSGKTELLRRTLTDLAGRVRAGVIVGDLATDNDARRLRGAGAPVVQVTTGGVCHLEADMVARAAEALGLDGLDLLFIENVGNLVCPASYDLGEGARVVLLSVTEGEDKPLKYPVAFQGAGAVVVSKVDLAGAAGFDRETALHTIRRVAPEATVLEVSARTGQGLESWYEWLDSRATFAPSGESGTGPRPEAVVVDRRHGEAASGGTDDERIDGTASGRVG
ncbi:MAG TPA: hydrogenase nickel incorporation protein HypB [Isosphaeraceae bacterium]|jgi:hydrogenase nickel incorporation protein HypB